MTPTPTTTPASRQDRAADAGAAAALDERVQQEVVRLTLDRTRLSNIATLPGALLIVWLLWPYIEHGGLLLWLAAKTTVCLVRWSIDRFAQRGAAERLPRFGDLYALALAVDGALFGMLGWSLLPQDVPSIHAAMAATLVGIAAIALVVLSASWRSCMAFIVPLLLPGTVQLLLAGSRIEVYLGAGMLLYTLLLASEVRRTAAHTCSMLRLGFQMDQLARERQAALEQAQRGDAAKSRFLATMSHEMRTPLHGLLGLAREVQRDGLDTAGRASRLQALERTGDHLLGIINDVLDYSKIESGRLRLDHRDFELGALVELLHTMCRRSASERGLALDIDNRLERPCWVHGDPARLRQILLNLLGNAIKFTDHGRVTLIAERAAAGKDPLPLTFEVRDTGPGVPAAERERIFDAFHQADGSYARRKGGTGLGLAVSRELAQAMGGELDCIDDGRAGATFRFSVALPRAAAPALPQAAAAPATPVAPIAARVLLVEDNEVNAIVARAVLERAGATVTLAPDGESAVALARDGAHDLILMDCQMPGIDGFEATARIRADERLAAARRVPIVALTANALEGDRQRCLDAGMDDHLSKPFQEQDLLVLLRRHLGAA